MDYTIRKPKTTDLFVVSKIIKTIGIDNIVNCFNAKEVKDLAKKVSKDKKTYSDEDAREVGILVVKNIGELIFDKLDLIQNDLIKYVSLMTGLEFKVVEDLPIAEFAKIVMEIIKEPDFVDFIKVVLKSFN